jgi:amino acid transporter
MQGGTGVPGDAGKIVDLEVPPLEPNQRPAPKKELSLFDSSCLIVGIIIGAGIYRSAPEVARGAGSAWGFLAIWAAGGLISLFGAIGYAELATAWPEEGGDYVYLKRAYGRWAGFLFGWIQLAVVRPGDIAVMGFAFATYAQQLYDPFARAADAAGAAAGAGAEGGASAYPTTLVLYAVLATVVLTTINVMGVREGKWTQNILTTVKALGLLAIVAVAAVGPAGTGTAAVPEPFPLGLAFICVLFTYGGWNEMAYVAAEVRDPQRNIVRALVLGTAAVTILYLLVNGAFLYTLGYGGLAASEAVATETVSAVFPNVGGRLISALVCISALGAINGLIFTGARISYALGAEHRIFRCLGRWDPKRGTPAASLIVQGAIAVALIVVLASFRDAILYTAAPVYMFYLATSVAVMVLRRREPAKPRPYRVTGFPFTTLIFCAVCAYLIRSAVIYRPEVAEASLGILLLGLPIYWVSRRFEARR